VQSEIFWLRGGPPKHPRERVGGGK
jgi:hypothetical protein